MRNINREIDKTYLSVDSAEERGRIHRDLLAHSLRWSHVAKYLQSRYKESIVLDVGCGKEMPLAKTLYSNRLIPLLYTGVDANKFSIPEMLTGKKMPVQIWPETDFCALDIADVSLPGGQCEAMLLPRDNDNYVRPNVVTCLEVLEHITPEHCRRMLQHFLSVTSQDCHYFVSTPCWNGSAAGNHINEMTFGALGSLFEDLGYRIEGVFGTFASISDYQDQLSCVGTYDRSTGKLLAETDLRPIFAALRNYYDTNVLALIFAPLFPAHSRNCLWHLSRRIDKLPNYEMFTRLESQPTPWSSHTNWSELSGYNHGHSVACMTSDAAKATSMADCGKRGIWLPR